MIFNQVWKKDKYSNWDDLFKIQHALSRGDATQNERADAADRPAVETDYKEPLSDENHSSYLKNRTERIN